jgi:GH24 family phage-related lysozyme (muramidase)
MYSPSAQAQADMPRYEGKSLSVYADSRGLPTQGIGRHHGVKFGDPDIDEATEYRWLAEDMQTAYADALYFFSSLDDFDLVRKEALIQLAFNMGRDTLSQFAPFIEYVNARQWDEAAYHLLVNMHHHITPYVLETGSRAAETALRICSGNVLEQYRA